MKSSCPAIPWSAVRRDYETSLIGQRALARRYGIRSDNQIRRRRGKEGWRRDKRAIVGRLWALGNAATAAPPDVTTADGRARLRGKIMRQQSAVGKKMMTAGVDVLRQINVVMGDDQQQADAAACLLRAGVGERGTLAGLLRVTGGLCTRGSRIEWDALGGPPADAEVQEKAPSGSTVSATTVPRKVGTTNEDRAAHAKHLLDVIESARLLRQQGMTMLRLARCVLIDPDAQKRRKAARRLSRMAGRTRCGMISILRAGMDLIASGIRIENQTLDLLDDLASPG